MHWKIAMRVYHNPIREGKKSIRKSKPAEALTLSFYRF